MAAIGVLWLLAVTAVYSGSLVMVSSTVEVMRGRTTFIKPKELNISMDPTENCKVEVVMNEPATQRVGRLSPQVRGTLAVLRICSGCWCSSKTALLVICLQVFDCRFLEDELKYVHNGSPQLDEDTVMLRVYRSVDISELTFLSACHH